MRGYRHLRNSNRIDKIATVKQTLTNSKLDQCGRPASKPIFGAGLKDAELIVRQYLLARIADVNLNKSLLYALGEPGSAVVYPLPREWRQHLRQHGFKVAEFRSALQWNGMVIIFLMNGIATIVNSFVVGAKEVFRSAGQMFGRYVYFDGLIAGNLPNPDSNHVSYDIVTWYRRWPGRIAGIDAFCHNVRDLDSRLVQDTPVISVPSGIPPLDRPGLLARYAGWGLMGISAAIINFVRGCWWDALLMREAALSATVRIHEDHRLARDYLFHNSTWIYRPLWTYEAEKKGSRVIFYFYSTNCESLKGADGYPPLNYGWQAMNWPLYLVWDDYQADFVRRAVGESANVRVVGPIWFHNSAQSIPLLPPSSVAIFDVQPHRASRYCVLGMPEEYYTPHTGNQFLLDVWEVLASAGSTAVLKRKRDVGRLLHPRYEALVERLSRSKNFLAVPPEVPAQRLIEHSTAVISMPFTSTALLAREQGKPSVYYDPHGCCEKDDRAAHGVEVLCGKAELQRWVSKVIDEERTTATLAAGRDNY